MFQGTRSWNIILPGSQYYFKAQSLETSSNQEGNYYYWEIQQDNNSSCYRTLKYHSTIGLEIKAIHIGNNGSRQNIMKDHQAKSSIIVQDTEPWNTIHQSWQSLPFCNEGSVDSWVTPFLDYTNTAGSRTGADKLPAANSYSGRMLANW